MFIRCASRLASAALLLPAFPFGGSASSRDHRQVPRSRDGGGRRVRRGLQTCTAADGFTVTSDAFPVMTGCYTEEEVPPNGGGTRLEVMRYSSSNRAAMFAVGTHNPYFGHKWLAFYYEDGVVGGDVVLACQTNEDIGMDLTPADLTLTWECDLDGDDTLETPIATESMLSISCGCDSESSSGGKEPSPSPVSITLSPIITPTPVTAITTTVPASITPSQTVTTTTGTPIASTTTTPTMPSRTVTIAPVVHATSSSHAPTKPLATTTSAPTALASMSGPVAQPADPASGTVCSNGLSGVEADEICCALSCGLCGGVGCGSVPGLTGDQCCISTIEASGELCSITGAAPCRVDPPAVNPSTCTNGLPGVADGDACCAEACNVCGGVNCGNIAGTNGATDCCSGVIRASGLFCDDTGAAPCVMTYDGNDSYEGPSVSRSSSESTFSMAPTPAGYTAPPTSVDGVRGGVFESVAPTSAPTSTGSAATPSPALTLVPSTAIPIDVTTTLSPRESPPTSPEHAVTTSAPEQAEEGNGTSGATRTLSIASASSSAVVTLVTIVAGVLTVLAAAHN